MTATKLRGPSVPLFFDYDVNSLYAGSVTPLTFTPAAFTPSMYSRRDHVIAIEGPWACDVDAHRALTWARDNDMEAFPVYMVHDDGKGVAEIHFTTTDDAVVVMLALA